MQLDNFYLEKYDSTIPIHKLTNINQVLFVNFLNFFVLQFLSMLTQTYC